MRQNGSTGWKTNFSAFSEFTMGKGLWSSFFLVLNKTERINLQVLRLSFTNVKFEIMANWVPIGYESTPTVCRSMFIFPKDYQTFPINKEPLHCLLGEYLVPTVSEIFICDPYFLTEDQVLQCIFVTNPF